MTKSWEGSMVRGVKDGLGKEWYKNGGLMYDGGYRKGEWHGEGVKVYHFDGELEFWGKIVNRMREGFGKAYWENGNLNYAGNWREDKPAGNYIVVRDENGGIRFEGCAEDRYLHEY